jgi:hypothetical protein
VGWFANDRWREAIAKEKRWPEINICAEALARGTDDIAETLIHEMVHYANALDGVRDCSRFQYHNRRFRDRYLSVGLHCEKLGGRGWSETSLSPGLLARVREVALDPAAFARFRPEDERAKVWPASRAPCATNRRNRRWGGVFALDSSRRVCDGCVNKHAPELLTARDAANRALSPLTQPAARAAAGGGVK